MTAPSTESPQVAVDLPDDVPADARGATYRMIMAGASLISGLVATYLHLWKLGYMGPLTCGAGHGCEIVQLSSWGWFLGVDVALIGAVGYAAIFLVSVLGTLPRWESAKWPTVVLMALIYPAVLFTVRLKYAEFVVLKTFCPWCAVSAVTITLCAVLVTLDWLRVRRLGA
jgi:uncharacterized membrane protein